MIRSAFCACLERNDWKKPKLTLSSPFLFTKFKEAHIVFFPQPFFYDGALVVGSSIAVIKKKMLYEGNLPNPHVTACWLFRDQKDNG